MCEVVLAGGVGLAGEVTSRCARCGRRSDRREAPPRRASAEDEVVAVGRREGRPVARSRSRSPARRQGAAGVVVGVDRDVGRAADHVADPGSPWPRPRTRAGETPASGSRGRCVPLSPAVVLSRCERWRSRGWSSSGSLNARSKPPRVLTVALALADLRCRCGPVELVVHAVDRAGERADVAALAGADAAQPALDVDRLPGAVHLAVVEHVPAQGLGLRCSVQRASSLPGPGVVGENATSSPRRRHQQVACVLALAGPSGSRAMPPRRWWRGAPRRHGQLTPASGLPSARRVAQPPARRCRRTRRGPSG